MIEVKGAKKYYNRGKRNQVTAIDNTTLSFGDTGLVAILGNSGCGKTTLLNMIGGLDKPDSGQIYINGKKMNGIFSSRTDNIRNLNVGYIFQNYHLVDDWTVFENVAVVLRMLGIRNKEEVKKSVYYVLDKVGLYRYRNRPASALSGGERQRVGIARAIVKNPGIIIADEPTGNLDSGNSLEVMNIIKTISKEKLVILVTHERTLADFYADRIIEIVDGRVVDDRSNEHDRDLDYRVDNKLYLKDFEKQSSVSGEGVSLDFYSDGSSDVKLTIVLRSGNLYIQCEDKKTELVDGDSAIELVDDHYHALSKEEAEQHDFDYRNLEHGGKKLRYHSIYNIFNLMINGFKKLLNYPLLKKILLAGFLAASMFVMFSISNYLGIKDVTDDKFVTVNKEYLKLQNSGNTVASYLECENLEGVGYILPGNSLVGMQIDYSDYYYQTSNASDSFSASLTARSLLQQDTLIAGRMPEATNEIVVDKMALDEMLKYGVGEMLGLKHPEDYVGKECFSAYPEKFVIVGICDTQSPVMYAEDSILFEIVRKSASGGYTDYEYYDKFGGATVTANGEYNDEDNNAIVTPVEEAKGKLTLKKGKMPENDYEVIIHYDLRYEYKIGKKLPSKVNGVQLTVVGYYTSTEEENTNFTNYNTCKYKYLASTAGITIYPENKASVLDYYTAKNMNIEDCYAVAKRDYMASIQDQVNTTVIIAATILAISLVEIFLMLRSSFLSRVKEVGTLRAIGLKKSDVYKMFLGEILAITTLTAPIGFLIMGKILSTLTSVSYFADMYLFNSKVVLFSAAIVYGFNIIVGLLPVFFTLRKTPAKILSRTDVD